MLCIFNFSKLYTFLNIKEKLIQFLPLTSIGPLLHHNRVFKLACTCASLTPAPRFQGSSSLCPSPFNCITSTLILSFVHSSYFLLALLSPSSTLLSFLLSFFHSSFLLLLFFSFFTLLSFYSTFLSSFLL